MKATAPLSTCSHDIEVHPVPQPCDDYPSYTCMYVEVCTEMYEEHDRRSSVRNNTCREPKSRSNQCERTRPCHVLRQHTARPIAVCPFHHRPHFTTYQPHPRDLLYFAFYVLAASVGSSATSFASSSLPLSAVPSLSSGFFRNGSTCVPQRGHLIISKVSP